VTPVSAPATPAAQPYGYRPSYREQKIADMTDYYRRPIYVLDEHMVSLMPQGRELAH
jgi:hypothetical protein